MNAKFKTLPIRIAYVIDELGIGGTERQLKLLVEKLDRNCFAPVLFVLRGSVAHSHAPADTPVRSLNIRSLASRDGVTRLLRFAGQLRRERFDIVQTFFQDATIVGVAAGRLAGVSQVIMSVRDMLFWAKPLSLTCHWLSGLFAHAVIVNSKAVKDSLKHVAGRKVCIIPNGIEVGDGFIKNRAAKQKLAHELAADPTLPFIVLVANCNRPVKRVDLLIEAIPLVTVRNRALFIVVGDGHLRTALEKRAHHLGIAAHLRFLGHRRDVPEILAGSDMAVNTSDSEGFSNAVLEAMRAGLPVVATGVGGNRELLHAGQNGLLFDRGDFRALAFQIMKLLENPDECKRMGSNNARMVATHFSRADMIVKHQRLYRRMRSV